MIFETIQATAGDPLLALMNAFRADTREAKIDLGVGVYKDEQGRTPVLSCVKQAEAYLLDTQKSKSYIGSAGAPELAQALQGLIFQGQEERLAAGLVVTAQTPGGTGALRVAGDFIHAVFPQARIWVSTPTWSNHFNVFESAGVAVSGYPYYDAATQGVDFAGMMAALQRLPAGDVVLLHACCHNPTGIDLTGEQWHQVGQLLRERGLLPLVDMAYQGFAAGVEEDTQAVDILLEYCPEMLIASSCSKNFGLYNERIGALTLVGANPRDTQAAFSQINNCIRGNYSNPPAHGAGIVSTILGSAELRRLWQEELAAMRQRIADMRQRFVDGLKAQGVQQDFDFITRQRGMFSYSGLTPEQVRVLREEEAIYIVDSGRINVAGMTPDNLQRLCREVARVLGGS